LSRSRAERQRIEAQGSLGLSNLSGFISVILIYFLKDEVAGALKFDFLNFFYLFIFLLLPIKITRITNGASPVLI